MGLLNRKVSIKTPIRYRPKTYNELQDIIVDLLKNGQTNLNCIDVSNIKDMSWLFSNINKHIKIPIKYIDLSEWDVSNVVVMTCMFAECEEFKSDLSNWDVSKVTDMRSMFWGCENFNSDLSTWDVSQIKYIGKMFFNCYSFNSDLSNWNVSNVKDMYYMFGGCTALMENKLIPAWYKFN